MTLLFRSRIEGRPIRAQRAAPVGVGPLNRKRLSRCWVTVRCQSAITVSIYGAIWYDGCRISLLPADAQMISSELGCKTVVHGGRE